MGCLWSHSACHTHCTLLSCLVNQIRFFPLEFDVLELVTDDLKGKLVPVRHRLKELEESCVERSRESRRTKGGSALMTNILTQAIATAFGSETGCASRAITQRDISQVIKEENELFVEEMAYRDRDRRELEELEDRELRSDVGCSISGLYDLVGIIAHEEAMADGGHYVHYLREKVCVYRVAPGRRRKELV